MSTVKCDVEQCKYNKSKFCEKLSVFVCGGGCSELQKPKEYVKQIVQPDINDLYEEVEEDDET